jgi:hypothetical protein
VYQLQINDRFGFDATKAVEEKSKAEGIPSNSIISAVEKEAAHRSKAYLFLMIPFWGLLFYLLFWRSNKFLVPHLIFATHNISFLIMLFLIYYPLAYLLFGLKNIGDDQLIVLAIIYLVYLFMAVRKVYHRHVIWSLLKTTISFAGLIGLFIFYREGITIWTLSQ